MFLNTLFKWLKDLQIKLCTYNIVMSVIDEILRMSKSGCGDKELLEYVCNNYDEIECE